MPFVRAKVEASWYSLILISLMRDAISLPTRASHSSYEIFSSCLPTASLLEGVNIGSLNFADSFKPCGSFMPHSDCVF